MKPDFLKSFLWRWISLLALALLASMLLTSCGGSLNTAPLVFTATLVGSAETPPNNSPGQGVGILLLEPGSGQFSASVVTSGVAETVAHIHQGAPGVAGPIIFPLAKASGSAVWTASGTMTLAQEVLLRDGGFYFNVDSPTFQNGEIRGQILVRTPTRQQLQQLQQLRQQSPLLDQQLLQIEQQQQMP